MAGGHIDYPRLSAIQDILCNIQSSDGSVEMIIPLKYLWYGAGAMTFVVMVYLLSIGESIGRWE